VIAVLALVWRVAMRVCSVISIVEAVVGCTVDSWHGSFR
jgi:hypothetical protein